MLHVLDETTQRLLQSSIQIQSPITILKELFDNAVDADSKNIFVTIKDSGLSLISVQDDGSGISQSGLNLIGKNRFTSKDINQSQQGFRGEALYVTAAVSQLTVISKSKDQSIGYQLHIDETANIVEAQCLDGTRVEVKNLFFNIPVRQQYLQRQIGVLSRQIAQFCFHYCLAHLNQDFHVVLNNQLLLNTTQLEDKLPQSLFNRLFGVQSNMMNIDQQTMDYGLQAYISGQNGGIPCNNQQKLFVILNNRPIQNNDIISAIRKVFKEKSAVTQPIGVVYLQLPRGTVDFNISADKSIAKIIQNEQLLKFIETTYRTALCQDTQFDLCENNKLEQHPRQQTKQSEPPQFMMSNISRQVVQSVQQHKHREIQTKRNNIVGSNIQRHNDDDEPVVLNTNICDIADSSTESGEDFDLKLQFFSQSQNQQKRVEQSNYKDRGTEQSNNQEKHQQIDSQLDLAIANFVYQPDISSPIEQAQTQFSTVPSNNQLIFGGLTVLGQYNRSFILATKEDQYYLVDQHSLDEAVRFEQLSTDLKLPRQNLICSKQLNLSTEQNVLIRLLSKEVALRLGFSFRQDGDSWLLDSVGIIDGKQLGNSEFLQLLEEEQPKFVKDVLANRACKSSVKLGDAMSFGQMRELLQRADACKNPWNCPHGRPTIQKIFQ